MRVGLLTSYQPHEIGIAWATLPLMKRYCAIRGYSLVVGTGRSPQAMFDAFAPQFETAMLFVPITFVITDPSIRIEHGGYRQAEPPAGLGTDCSGRDLLAIRHLTKEAA